MIAKYIFNKKPNALVETEKKVTQNIAFKKFLFIILVCEKLSLNIHISFIYNFEAADTEYIKNVVKFDQK